MLAETSSGNGSDRCRASKPCCHQIAEPVHGRGIVTWRLAFHELPDQGDPFRLMRSQIRENRIQGVYPRRAIIARFMPVLDIHEIQRILPHRYPFLLVDRIVEMEGERIVAIKNVTFNEPFFGGHFPGFPVMPGVLIIEAMAQAAGVLVLKNIADRDRKLVLLVAIENARFRKPVMPGDTLRLEMAVIKRRTNVAKMAGRATVDGQLVAEAEVMCKLADKEDTPDP